MWPAPPSRSSTSTSAAARPAAGRRGRAREAEHLLHRPRRDSEPLGILGPARRGHRHLHQLRLLPGGEHRRAGQPLEQPQAPRTIHSGTCTSGRGRSHATARAARSPRRSAPPGPPARAGGRRPAHRRAGRVARRRPRPRPRSAGSARGRCPRSASRQQRQPAQQRHARGREGSYTIDGESTVASRGASSRPARPVPWPGRSACGSWGWRPSRRSRRIAPRRPPGHSAAGARWRGRSAPRCWRRAGRGSSAARWTTARAPRTSLAQRDGIRQVAERDLDPDAVRAQPPRDPAPGQRTSSPCCQEPPQQGRSHHARGAGQKDHLAIIRASS